MKGTRSDTEERSALHSQLLSLASAIVTAAQEAGVVPAGCCLLVSVGNADAAVVLANGDSKATERALEHIAEHAGEIVAQIHRKTGN